MWNKIYSMLLAISTLAMGVLIGFQYSWLQSKTAPKDVIAQYEFYSNISWIFLLISSLMLLIVGNVVLWRTRRTWAMWSSLLYFAVFMIAQTFWLDRIFFDYQKEFNLTDNVISFSALSGVVFVVMATVIVFFNQYLVKRLQAKMSPAEAPAIESLPAESTQGEKKYLIDI